MRDASTNILKIGRFIALAGVVLPLLLIGGLKFTQTEVEALKPLIGGTPWLAWLYPAFGEAGASYFLGIVEIATALLLVASPWAARAGVAAGALATVTFLTTCSIMLALPIWDPALGFPALGPLGSFLIKDVAFLGIAVVVLGESLDRLRSA
ncbi:YkgB family protein [Mesorhizobium caraganae]|uniref:YkgB family protein n=1 Tax=Mesorhizobium caraganae TaxID=483206 RepID=A0ABV1YUN5_9HYPH